jgi:hypothetical protein
VREVPTRFTAVAQQFVSGRPHAVQRAHAKGGIKNLKGAAELELNFSASRPIKWAAYEHSSPVPKPSGSPAVKPHPAGDRLASQPATALTFPGPVPTHNFSSDGKKIVKSGRSCLSFCGANNGLMHRNKGMITNDLLDQVVGTNEERQRYFRRTR